MQRPPRFFYRAYFGLTWLPITPPTAAPPTAPTALPPVSTEPATAPTPAPMAVFLSWPDILAQAVRLNTSAAREVVAASFLMVCMMVSPLDSNYVAQTWSRHGPKYRPGRCLILASRCFRHASRIGLRQARVCSTTHIGV